LTECRTAARAGARQNHSVLTRSSGYLTLRRPGSGSAAAKQLQGQGYVVLEQVFDDKSVQALKAEVERVYAEYPPDERSTRHPPEHWKPFRYEMLNRSATVQKAIANRKILSTIEPLLGEDCHVIANTAWWQPPDNNKHGGRFWHIDSGPHVPRPEGVPWDERIPYPVFAVAAHIYLMDCPLKSGPTGVIPGSHTSGQPPPRERMADDNLDYEGTKPVALVARAGDVALFVSDVWHRRLPSRRGDPGRMFIQCHYGRRDLAQRLRPTAEVNQLSDEARTRAKTKRQQTLVGLHRNGFYDG
jgi:ectoine hydroxylase-related dioxygenase (phytanoyl-CoA dioxygenase family)